MDHGMFRKLKKGQSVIDVWYGPGKVIDKNQRWAYIKLDKDEEVSRYDQAHVNEFIKIVPRKKTKKD